MISVFKTSVRSQVEVQHLKPHIDKIVSTWNFDLQDCDNILRIDCEEDIVMTIIHLLKMHDFHCEELE